jgi:hypothetical protein
MTNYQSLYIYKILGFCSNAVVVFVLLAYGITSIGDGCPCFETTMLSQNVRY